MLKSNQSNFNLQSSDSNLVLSYLITTVSTNFWKNLPFSIEKIIVFSWLFMSHLKCSSNWRRISKLLLGFGCLFNYEAWNLGFLISSCDPLKSKGYTLFFPNPFSTLQMFFRDFWSRYWRSPTLDPSYSFFHIARLLVFSSLFSWFSIFLFRFEKKMFPKIFLRIDIWQQGVRTSLVCAVRENWENQNTIDILF